MVFFIVISSSQPTWIIYALPLDKALTASPIRSDSKLRRKAVC
jgi:hypothetical protein